MEGDTGSYVCLSEMEVEISLGTSVSAAASNFCETEQVPHSCRSLLTKGKAHLSWKKDRSWGDSRGAQELSRRFLNRERCQFVEEIDCVRSEAGRCHSRWA